MKLKNLNTIKFYEFYGIDSFCFYRKLSHLLQDLKQAFILDNFHGNSWQ